MIRKEYPSGKIIAIALIIMGIALSGCLKEPDVTMVTIPEETEPREDPLQHAINYSTAEIQKIFPNETITYLYQNAFEDSKELGHDFLMFDTENHGELMVVIFDYYGDGSFNRDDWYIVFKEPWPVDIYDNSSNYYKEWKQIKSDKENQTAELKEYRNKGRLN